MNPLRIIAVIYAVLFAGVTSLNYIPGLADFASTSEFLSWGYDKGMLNDGGDVVVLRNPMGAPVAGACDTWGGFPCPKA